MRNPLRWLAELINLFWSAWRDLSSALRTLLGLFALGRRRSRRDREQSDRDRRRASSRCVQIDEWAYKRPDPTIYSQLYLMAMGFGVTWDNPDIQLYKNGVAVPSSNLIPDTEYEIVATVWNNSTDAPIVDLPVRFGYLSFGVGMQLHPIADALVTLGVKGGLDHPAPAKVKWRTPAAAGHYCIQVFLVWSDDANLFNNLGSENTDVVVAHSNAETTFAVRNATAEPLHYRFEVDTYAIPRRRPCDEVNEDEQLDRLNRKEETVPADHDPRNHPLPPGWEVRLAPEELDLGPDSERNVRVTVTVPDEFTGRQPINIRAFHENGGAGGVTFYVEKS